MKARKSRIVVMRTCTLRKSFNCKKTLRNILSVKTKAAPLPLGAPSCFPIPLTPEEFVGPNPSKSPMKTKSKVLPLGNRLLISPPPELAGDKKDLVKVQGIFLPEVGATGKVMPSAYWLAEVIAAGPECKSVKAGDKVTAVRNLAWEVKIDGVVLGCFIRENECHAAVRS
jgi:hypothetical protein